MSKGRKETTTVTSGPDRNSQQYIDRQRQQAEAGAQNILHSPNPFFLGPDSRSIQDQIQPFFNPYLENVISGVHDQYDRSRSLARRATDDESTFAGAFGGSRAAVTEGVRLGELDRAENMQIGGLLSSGYRDAMDRGLAYSEYVRNLRERRAQEPIFRNQMAQGLYQGGLGPTGVEGTTEVTQSQGTLDYITQLAGLGLAGWNAFQAGQGPSPGTGYGPRSSWPTTTPNIPPFYGPGGYTPPDYRDPFYSLHGG